MAFPVEEKFILKAEEELGVRFPDSYRSSMMSINGGGVEVRGDVFSLYPFFDTSEKKRLKRTTNSNVRETLAAREHHGLPADLVAIGDNGGGDLLVYRVLSDRSIEPTLFFFDHESRELTPITADFGELAHQQ